jgi:bacteriorhodopsin
MMMIENNIDNNNNGDDNSFLLFINDITLVLLLISLTIFLWIAIRSKKNLRSFQFQTSVFLVIWILGEIVNVLKDNGIGVIVFSSLPENVGLQIHLISMVFFSVMLWLRYYYSRKSGKEIINSIDNSS